MIASSDGERKRQRPSGDALLDGRPRDRAAPRAADERRMLDVDVPSKA